MQQKKKTRKRASMLTVTPSVEEMPLDAIALCDVLARILSRCLKDQEARLLLFPNASVHALQEKNQTVQETSQGEGSSIPDVSMTGRPETIAS